MFLSTRAATAAKLGAKVEAAGSGLWHKSLRYKLFMLDKGKKNTSLQCSEVLIIIFLSLADVKIRSDFLILMKTENRNIQNICEPKIRA